MKTYPLEGNPDLLHVCWSKKQWRHSGYNDTTTHIVRKGGDKTLCGVPISNDTLLHKYAAWKFAIWSRADDGWGVESVGCLRCRRSRQLETINESEDEMSEVTLESKIESLSEHGVPQEAIAELLKDMAALEAESALWKERFWELAESADALKQLRNAYSYGWANDYGAEQAIEKADAVLDAVVAATYRQDD